VDGGGRVDREDLRIEDDGVRARLARRDVQRLNERERRPAVGERPSPVQGGVGRVDDEDVRLRARRDVERCGHLTPRHRWPGVEPRLARCSGVTSERPVLARLHPRKEHDPARARATGESHDNEEDARTPSHEPRIPSRFGQRG